MPVRGMTAVCMRGAALLCSAEDFNEVPVLGLRGQGASAALRRSAEDFNAARMASISSSLPYCSAASQR